MTDPGISCYDGKQDAQGSNRLKSLYGHELITSEATIGVLERSPGEVAHPAGTPGAL